jgi:hypothetical protein
MLCCHCVLQLEAVNATLADTVVDLQQQLQHSQGETQEAREQLAHKTAAHELAVQHNASLLCNIGQVRMTPAAWRLCSILVMSLPSKHASWGACMQPSAAKLPQTEVRAYSANTTHCT